jgi:phosphatidylserine/phosphatidylglycerophosphate/cardiolipin synthase-like enzyme
LKNWKLKSAKKFQLVEFKKIIIMRAKSNVTDGYIIYAVSGTNTISFAIDFRNSNTDGLLGFSVERIEKTHGKRKYLNGYKVFRELIKNPTPETVVSTYDHPVQSFVWDDFACYDDTEYEYLFHPMKGTPKQPDRNYNPISVKISTEKLFSDFEHDIFFNRGVASSQAYCREFQNIRPNEIEDPVLRQKAWDWLSRQLDDAILQFIKQAKKGDTLLGCFYEFHYEPVVKAFKDAIGKGVIVKLIIDAKVNEYTNKKGEFFESFPRKKNLDVLQNVGISIDPSDGIVYYREAKKNDIQHNKFMVLIEKTKGNLPTQVWTGSTNISLGGIHGQTNVGHWIRNPKVAEKYEKYWKILSDDPGAQDQDDRATKTIKNNVLKKLIESLQKNIEFTSLDDIPYGITPVFSPRRGLSMLDTYVKTMDNAKDIACVTLAFGINKIFKENLKDNTNKDHITFLLLEKEDKPTKKSKDPFVYIGAKNNVYKSWGAYIEDKLYKWAEETSTRSLKLNQHVAYIHSKFMLVDPLSSDPIIVSGSANFSEASTNDNDENMVIIRGNQRAADIYFTEFNRIFNHYYFRAVYNNAKEKKRTDSESLFLKSNDSWLNKYSFGKLRYKRVDMLSKMTGF